MEKLILPDGSAIGSGVWGETAITSVLWTRHRNRDGELFLGSAVGDRLEVELFSYEKPQIPPETRLIYQENGVNRHIFYCQGLQRLSPNRYRLTALDAMTRFDRELTDFWSGEQTARQLLLSLCDRCGVATKLETIPGGETIVPAMPGYTGRQVLQFLGQLGGRYFYMDAQENLCAGWYDETTALSNYLSLTCAEFTTPKIEKVWLRRNKNDAGTVFPDGESEGNALIIQGNPIFKGNCAPIAERIFRQFSTFSHTPFSCKLLPGEEVEPGSFVEFTDLDGITRTGAVMFWEKRNGTITVRGVGSPVSTKAFNSLTLEELEGQMLTISQTAQGLEVSHSDLLGNVGSLQLSLSGITGRVTGLEATAEGLLTQTTELSQTAQGLSLAVSQLGGSLEGKTDREELSQVTEHFTFDAAGMTIQNSASGMGIQVSENQVAFTGGDDPTTLIRPDNMETTRLSVGKRLDLGGFSFLPRTDGNLSFRFTGQSD